MTEPELDAYSFQMRLCERGEVTSIGDGIAWVEGLPSAALDQLVLFEGERKARGMIFHLERERVGVISLDREDGIASGTRLALAEPRLEIPVGDALLGRIVDPLSRPLDGGEPPRLAAVRPIDLRAPTIAERDFVHAPLHTGNTVIDTMLPIGRGQRQLFIGDRGLGKSSLAIDAILNQHDGLLSVYVLIGKRRSDVTAIIETLRSTDALARTVVVVAEASAAPGLQYIAPYAGCAMAEEWMRAGRHVLVVYDDLTRHAYAYRTLSLLLRRPPGREAYPGDIFFLHSRLLERATVLSPELGGGSLTALPIIETEEGEITAYIPTNLISITDGQISFSQSLFAAGLLPAIDVAKSVSRVGGKAQADGIRAESGRIRLEYLQFLELERFARLGTRLDPTTSAKLQRGRVLRELFKQDRLHPHEIAYELAWMIAFNEGLFDAVTPERIPSLRSDLESFVHTSDLHLTAPRGDWLAALRARFSALSAEAVR